MSDPWLAPKTRFISYDEALKRKQRQAVEATDALSNQPEYVPAKTSGGGSILGKVLGGALHGLETWGNQVQSVPAYLFTRGTVQDGQYTTSFNPRFWENPESHIEAQRKTGLLDETANPFLESFRAANRAGQAFSEDPDISSGVKFGTGVLFDPTTYTPGVVSKVGKIPGIGRAATGSSIGSKALRTGLRLTEGFDKPSTALKFAVGGAAATEVADRLTDNPLIRIGAGLGGGIAGTFVGGSKLYRGFRALGEAINGGEEGAIIKSVVPMSEGDKQIKALQDKLQELRKAASEPDKYARAERGQPQPTRAHVWDSRFGKGSILDNIHRVRKEIEALGGQDVGFPIREEVYDTAINSDLQSRMNELVKKDKAGTLEEMSPEYKALKDELDAAWDKYHNYDRYKSVWEGASGDVRSASEIDAEIERLGQEQLNHPRSSEEWYSLEKQIEALEQEKGKLRSVDTAQEQASIKDSKIGYLGDEQLVNRIQGLIDNLADDTLSRSVRLRDEAALAEATQEANRRGLDYSASTEPPPNLDAAWSQRYGDFESQGEVPTNPDKLSDAEREFMRKLKAGEIDSQGRPTGPVAPTQPEVPPVITKKDLKNLPMEELGAIARDRNNPLRKDALEIITRPFANATKERAPKQPFTMREIPGKSEFDLEEIYTDPRTGKRFKKAIENEMESRRPSPGAPPEGQVGGTLPEEILDITPPTPGLTLREKVGNIGHAVQRGLGSNSLSNNPIATPIVRSAKEITNTLLNYSGILGRQFRAAERMFDADKDGLITSIGGVALPKPTTIGELALSPLPAGVKLTPVQQQALSDLGRRLEDVEKVVRDHNLQMNHGLTTFRSTAGSPAGVRYSTGAVSNAASVQEYMNSLADAVAKSSVRSEQGYLHTAAGRKGIILPPEVDKIIDKYLSRNLGSHSDASKLYSSVNNVLRGLWATGDLSRMFIQDLPLLFDNPAEWAKIQKNVWNVIRDPDFLSHFQTQFDKTRYGTGRPTITDWVRNGLEMTGQDSSEYEKGIAGGLKRIPVIGGVLEKSNRAFADIGDFNRLMQADLIWENRQLGIGRGKSLNGIKIPAGVSDDEAQKAIAKAVNRSSGTAKEAFGGDIGRAVLFAPRYLQGQLETIVQAVNPKGGIESQIARRQLLKMIAFGMASTTLANEIRGEDTIIDPRDSNFMRVRNVPGVGDLSLFGPWDSLVRGVVKSGIGVKDKDFGEALYLPRTKLAPIPSIFWDVASHKNVIGQPVDDPVKIGFNLLAPFGSRSTLDVSTEGVKLNRGIASTVTGIVGLKSSPLTQKEQLENALENAGIHKDDPDYLINRRQWIVDHPKSIPEDVRGNYRKSLEIQRDISGRRKANSDRTISNEQTLKDFRDTRSNLLKEQKDKLSTIASFDEAGDNSKQGKWLQSYFDLFDGAVDKVTGKVDSDLLEPKILDWSSKNGPDALDFVNRYLGTGLNTVEKAYYDDLQKLKSDGYFEMPRYQRMRSDLSDKEIQKYRDTVSNARSSDRTLARLDFAIAARRVLGGQLSSLEITDIINAGSDAYKSKELAAYQKAHPKELIWFNPRATWDTYKSTTNPPRVR